MRRLMAAIGGDSTTAGPDGDRLTPTTYIQRINTVGGRPPAAGDCAADTVAEQREIPYSARLRLLQGDRLIPPRRPAFVQRPGGVVETPPGDLRRSPHPLQGTQPMIDLAYITAIVARDRVADQFTRPAHPVRHPSLQQPVKRR